MANIIFPKPLPELKKENVPNEMGFTASEILTLQNVWILIKQEAKHIASQAFLAFYVKNDFLIERFRDPASGKFNLSFLHQHSYKVMHTYGVLIETCLQNAANFHVAMEDICIRHKEYGVTYSDIQIYTNFIIKYVMNHFVSKKSPTLETALNKLGSILVQHHVKNEELKIRGKSELHST